MSAAVNGALDHTYLRVQAVSVRTAALLLAAMLTCAISTSANATVLWEDYQGTQSIVTPPAGLVPGPNYDNNTGTDAQLIAALRAISGTPANAVLTGSDANINNGNVGVQAALCNINNASAGNLDDPTGAFPPCGHDVQGRVTYTLIKFAAAGTYTLTAAHDDQLDIDLSTDYTNTSYRSAAYDVPAGGAVGFTANETTFDTIGSFNVGANGACALMRLYWNNNGGRNFERLQWTTPAAVTQIIPASVLFDPSLPASSVGCTGSITATGATSVSLSKVIAGGRVNAADQFTVSVNQGGTLIAASGTSGSAIGNQASTGAMIVTAGTTYTFNDAMSAGSVSALSAYTSSIACTRNGTAFTPGGASPNWTVTPTTGQAIICTITNTGPNKPILSVAKTSNGPWTTNQIGSNYTLTIGNGGTAATAGTITLSDVLPTGILPSWTGTLTTGNWSCAFSGQTVTCTSSTSIAINANSTITLPVTVASAAVSPIINYSCVGGGGDVITTPPVPAAGNVDHCANVSTAVSAGNVNLSVVKSDSHLTYVPGASASYVITVANSGPNSAAGFKLSDVLPKGMTLNSAWICAPATTCVSGCVVAGTNCNGSAPAAPFAGDATTNILAGLTLNLPASSTTTITVPITYSGNPASY